MVLIPIRSATRRMESAERPSASATPIAACTTCPTLRPGFGPRLGLFCLPHNSAIVPAGFPPPLYSFAISHKPLLVILYRVQYSLYYFVRHTELGGGGGFDGVCGPGRGLA